jgi:hypothetical protein
MGAGDLIELALAALLLALALAWRPWWEPYAARLAQRPVWCMFLLAALPIALRLLLLPRHPAPVPDIYDEFSHLLVADTLRHFRLANPAHPFHRFFETFFVSAGAGLQLHLPGRPGHRTGAGLDRLRHSLGRRSGPCGRALRALLLDAARLDHARLGACGRRAGGDGVRTAQPMDELLLGRRAARGGDAWSSARCPDCGARGVRGMRRILGAGLAIHLLTRPYESVFLLLASLHICCRRGGRWQNPCWWRLLVVCRPSASRCCRTGKSPAVGQLPLYARANTNTASRRR